jgi:hypothetical protein
MHKPIEYQKIIALDIETSSEGKLLDIGCYGEDFYEVFSGWQEFFDYLLTVEGKARVIAHNGFGFDFITFNQWFLKNYRKHNFSDEDIIYLSSEHLIMGLVLKAEIAEYCFVDTTRYFPGQSLQRLAESFLGESKDDVPDDYISRMEDYKKKFPKKYYEYLRRDCELLYRIYTQFRSEINEFADIGELGLSSGSTALKTFRRWLHKTEPNTRIFSAPLHEDNEAEDFKFAALADYALRGGLTLYIGDGNHTNHKYEGVNHYDVVSMYPSIMRTIPVPCSPMVYADHLVKDFDTYRPGWYLCDFQQIQGRVPFLFSLESEYPTFAGQGILSHYELQFLERYGTFEVHDGVVYEDYCYPFDAYFSDLLNLRLSAKAQGQIARAHALKILANSLYGKFGQKPYREIISITSDRDWYDNYLEACLRDSNDSGITEYIVERNYILYGVQSDSTAFSNRFVGALVTSLARLKLAMLLNTYPTIYCDTDSIFTQSIIDDCFIGRNAGDFERSEMPPSPMICLGKKSYQYGEDKKFKGVPARNISIDEMNLMRYDVSVNVDYKSPAAWKTAMKSKIDNPNKFLPRSRRVKRGKSLAEMGLLNSSSKFFTAEETKNFLDTLLKLE